MAQCNVSDETEGFKPGNKRDTDLVFEEIDKGHVICSSGAGTKN